VGRNTRQGARGRDPLIEQLEARRLLAAADLDPTFGVGGLAHVELPVGAGATPVGAVQQADGKVVVATDDDGDQAVVRFNLDGSLDATFGDRGQVSGRVVGRLRAVALQSDGRIVVVSESTEPFDPDRVRVTRLNADGTPDPTFGAGGTSAPLAIPGIAYQQYAVSGIAVDALGRLVVSGTTEQASGNTDPFVARLTPQGAPDPTFSGDGIAFRAAAGDQYAARALLVQPDGRIVISVGYGGAIGGILVRFNADGSPDGSFGASGGQALLPSSWPDTEALASDGSGRLLAAGTSSTPTQTNAQVLRYTADGRLDTTFGTAGIGSAWAAGDTSEAQVSSVAVDAGGRIVVGGWVLKRGFPQRFMLVRMTPGGVADTTFDADGLVSLSLGTGDTRCVVALADAQGRVVGVGVDPANGGLAVVRRTATGAADTSFDVDGVAKVAGTIRLSDAPNKLARLPDGKLLVLDGVSSDFYSTGLIPGILRLNADGTLDETFGTRGTVRLPVPAINIGESGRDLAQWRDKVVVLTSRKLVRLNADGSLDTTFGGGTGVVNPTRVPSLSPGQSLAVDSLGRTYVAGFNNAPVARLTLAGALDTTFAGDGTFEIPGWLGWTPRSTLVDPQDRVLIAAGTRVYRILAGATLDPTFGVGGVVDTGATIDSMALVADGSIYVGGIDHAGAPRVRVLHLSDAGVPDAAYGDGGVATTGVSGVTPHDMATNALAVYPDGSVVAAVQLDTLYARPGSALVQFTPAGRPDATFDGDGVLFLPRAQNAPAFEYGVAIDDRGRILALGFDLGYVGTPYENKDIAVGRLMGRYDAEPPRVTAASFAPGTPSVDLTFNESVGATLAAGDFALLNVTTGETVPVAAVSLAYADPTRTATFTFPGYIGGVLPDGNYALTLAAGSVADAAGNALTASFTFDFFVLAGDATRDRVVNFDDLLALAKNYNKTGATFAQGDFTGDGIVNFDDLLVLAKNYNKTVPATGAAPTPAAAMDVQALAAAMGIAMPTTTSTKPTPPPAPPKKPVANPKPAPKPAPVARAVPAPVAPKPAPASVLRDDDKARPVFSTTRVAKPVPAPLKPKVVAKAKSR
jgi:uncharacterized delta-60 repeat protein